MQHWCTLNMAWHLLTLCLVMLYLLVTWNAASVEGVSSDVLQDGRVRVANSRQCQKLCWYLPLCATFSFNKFAKTGDNCILHSAPLDRSQYDM
jgi:hypothetical protein